MNFQKITLANGLTFSRILILIPFVALFYLNYSWANLGAVILYWAACLTDYFDGLAARQKNQISPLGQFLDPIADKLLISTTLIMLAGTNRLYGISLIPAIIILGRELFVAGLREYLSHEKIKVHVSILAKWKTAIQMISLSCLVYDDAKDFIWGIHEFGLLSLWVSAFLSILSGYEYWRKSYNHFI